MPVEFGNKPSKPSVSREQKARGGGGLMKEGKTFKIISNGKKINQSETKLNKNKRRMKRGGWR